MSPHLEFSLFLLLWSWKLGQGHQNLISSLLCPVLCNVPVIYPWKFGKNQTTGSQDIVQTRKCDANADSNGGWILALITAPDNWQVRASRLFEKRRDRFTFCFQFGYFNVFFFYWHKPATVIPATMRDGKVCLTNIAESIIFSIIQWLQYWP